jgi:hypothetical protein
MMTAPRGKNTTKEDPAPPKGNHTQPPADTTPPTDRHSPSERITVSLIPQAGEDLGRLQAQTGLSKTDLVNRAISLYEFIEAQRNAGHDILIRDKSTGETQIIVLV